MNLSVRPSRIPHAGMGLFTEEDIAEGTLVAEYTGEITTWKKVKDDWKNLYIYFVTEEFVIDAQHNPEVYARYANDAEGLTSVKGMRNNCEFANIEGRIFIRATRAISAQEEILVAYGKDYWETVRKNSA